MTIGSEQTGQQTIAPGARVLIRDAEWIVRRVDRTGTGGQSIQVIGVSEIVRNKEARFLTEIEGKSITVLDPAETELVPDASPQFRNSRLFLESLIVNRLLPATTCGLVTVLQLTTCRTSSIPHC